MKAVKKLFSKLIYLIAFLLLLILITIKINQNNIKPSESESALIKKFYGREINNANDIIFIQNLTISKITHSYIGSSKLNTKRILKYRKGLCYDRSFLMQKYFILQGITVRPVFLFWGKNKTSLLDVFKPSTKSHSVFEIFYLGKWYLIQTNTKMNRLQNLSEYLKKARVVPTHAHYIRYLSNRNGKFLIPGFLPDIYYF
jgi:hypothetical protein